MANQEHLKFFMRGMAAWNKWRQAHPDIKPDLRNIILSDKEFREKFKGLCDLDGADLSGADLSGVNLKGTTLKGANLSGANLSGTDLSGFGFINLSRSNLSSINLCGADLSNSNLSNQYLAEIDLSGASLSNANLEKVNLSKANLRNANLREANLNQANLYGTNLSGADCRGTALIKANLANTNLSGTNFGAEIDESTHVASNLFEANLNSADLRHANLFGASLVQASLHHADLNNANLKEANLREADLREANLYGTIFNQADLRGANLSGAQVYRGNFREANLYGAILYQANLTEADLSGATLCGATLVETNLTSAILTNCLVYGIAAWRVQLDEARQDNLIITPDNEPTITVDNLEVAQFIYLLLNNEKIRDVIDNITSKVVLILGRFTPQRKIILDALRDELRNRNYTPVLFDFQKPASRDFTETVRTLAHLSRFIIADLTDPSSIPQELQAIVPDLEVPVQPLLLEAKREYSMFVDFGKYHWVLPVYLYKDRESLIASLYYKIIEPAEKKARELALEKAKRLEEP